ncbi:hypothetical protein ACED25_12160 [Vibrio sp. 1F263]|uniref:hypothetical protein n=1 Tax=Vibrio sp. 1F263 TaxID=3230012 RepID=UPI00352C777C
MSNKIEQAIKINGKKYGYYLTFDNGFCLDSGFDKEVLVTEQDGKVTDAETTVTDTYVACQLSKTKRGVNIPHKVNVDKYAPLTIVTMTDSNDKNSTILGIHDHKSQKFHAATNNDAFRMIYKQGAGRTLWNYLWKAIMYGFCLYLGSAIALMSPIGNSFLPSALLYCAIACLIGNFIANLIPGKATNEYANEAIFNQILEAVKKEKSAAVAIFKQTTETNINNIAAMMSGQSSNGEANTPSQATQTPPAPKPKSVADMMREELNIKG